MASASPVRWRPRALVRGLHRICGLGLGALLAVIGLSGAVLVYQPELRLLAESGWRTAAPITSTGLGRALARIDAHPMRARFDTVDLPSQRLPVWQAFVGTHDRLYFAAADGAPLQLRERDADPLLWLRDLHVHLLAGERGQQVLGVLGGLAIALLGSGLYLWWPRWHSLRHSLRWHRQPPVLRWLSWHRGVAVWTLPLLWMAVLTGTATVYAGQVRQGLRWFWNETAAPSVPAPLAWRAVPIDWPAVLQAAQAALPGAELRRIALPRRDDGWVLIRARAAGEWHPNGRSLIWVDPYAARVAQVHDATRQGPGSRLSEALYPLHGGFVGGAAGRLLVAVGGLLPAVLALTGTLLWWRRRGPRPRRAGAPPAAGAAG